MYRFIFCVLSIILIITIDPAPAKGKSDAEWRAKILKLYPGLPLISAYDAYVKFKAGKGILINAGGEAFDRRHIIGSLRVHQEEVMKGKVKFPRLPKKGTYLLFYCY